MKKNYIIRYQERATQIGGNLFKYSTLMCVDNVGLVVKHDKDLKPTDDEVRRHLIGVSEHTILVQAESLQDALLEFYNYPECKTGTKNRAWELVNGEKQPVVEYAGCEHMRLSHGGCACAKYDEPTDGGCMVCVLDGLDEPPLDCPIDAQKSSKGWRHEVKKIGGVFVKQYSQLVFPMQPNKLEPVRVNKV